jgi:hypothetical protein
MRINFSWASTHRQLSSSTNLGQEMPRDSGSARELSGGRRLQLGTTGRNLLTRLSPRISKVRYCTVGMASLVENSRCRERCRQSSVDFCGYASKQFFAGRNHTLCLCALRHAVLCHLHRLDTAQSSQSKIYFCSEVARSASTRNPRHSPRRLFTSKTPEGQRGS